MKPLTYIYHNSSKQSSALVLNFDRELFENFDKKLALKKCHLLNAKCFENFEFSRHTLSTNISYNGLMIPVKNYHDIRSKSVVIKFKLLLANRANQDTQSALSEVDFHFKVIENRSIISSTSTRINFDEQIDKDSVLSWSTHELFDLFTLNRLAQHWDQFAKYLGLSTAEINRMRQKLEATCCEPLTSHASPATPKRIFSILIDQFRRRFSSDCYPQFVRKMHLFSSNACVSLEEVLQRTESGCTVTTESGTSSESLFSEPVLPEEPCDQQFTPIKVTPVAKRQRKLAEMLPMSQVKRRYEESDSQLQLNAQKPHKRVKRDFSLQPDGSSDAVTPVKRASSIAVANRSIENLANRLNLDQQAKDRFYTLYSNALPSQALLKRALHDLRTEQTFVH
ncbi:hypothetical protein Ciccas_004314 [Cichlidogyrus casuarinus]|uniref:Uncharacterized protein n=1 Tax=Cichlidogyrus casuarinus TaxID=1844966 RepID=A0ABD2QCB9_9PLAT